MSLNTLWSQRRRRGDWPCLKTCTSCTNDTRATLYSCLGNHNGLEGFQLILFQNQAIHVPMSVDLLLYIEHKHCTSPPSWPNSLSLQYVCHGSFIFHTSSFFGRFHETKSSWFREFKLRVLKRPTLIVFNQKLHHNGHTNKLYKVYHHLAQFKFFYL